MLVGLYGGTFDPVHIGHIHVGLTVKQALNLDQLRLVLAARPGHRDTPESDTEHRWEMLRLACAEHPELIPDDTELHRAGKSFTVTTVAAERSATPELDQSETVPCWIMGQDSFATLPSWHRWRELLDFCNLVVVTRPGDYRAEPAEVQDLCQQFETDQLDRSNIGQILRLKLPMKDVSATGIRRKLARGQPVEHLLADPVYAYIMRHKLYQTMENTI